MSGRLGISSADIRILNVLSKITLTPVHLTVAQTAEHQAAIQAAQALQTTSPTLSPTPSQTSFQPPSSPTTISSGTEVSHTPQTIHPISSSSEYNLKVQSLQTLVIVLRSLVTWAQQGIAATIESTSIPGEIASQSMPEDSPRSATPNPVSRSTSQGDTSNRAPFIDDPSQFEALKYRKTALQDALQKFNYKPKKVISLRPC
jgi:brefeldin A-inhibited guanine nucleotide-exchange protein